MHPGRQAPEGDVVNDDITERDPPVLQSTRIRRRAALGLALSLTLTTAAACGDDDDQDIDDASATTADAGSQDAGAGLDTDACDAYVALSGAFAGDPSQIGSLVHTFTSTAPEGLTDAAETVGATYQAMGEGGDPSAFSDPEFVEAASDVASAYFEGCETEEILDVTGVDFGFEGLPSEVPAGRVGIRFTNGTETEEAHEMVLFRRLDGVEDSVDELLALPEEELMSKVAMAGVLFADHADMEVNAMLDLEAGSYVALCFIPVGGAEDGPPHFAHGMVAEFDVA